jgi:hypothetical protein
MAERGQLDRIVDDLDAHKLGPFGQDKTAGIGEIVKWHLIGRIRGVGATPHLARILSADREDVGRTEGMSRAEEASDVHALADASDPDTEKTSHAGNFRWFGCAINPKAKVRALSTAPLAPDHGPKSC